MRLIIPNTLKGVDITDRFPFSTTTPTPVEKKAHNRIGDNRNALYDTGTRILIGSGNNAVPATASDSA